MEEVRKDFLLDAREYKVVASYRGRGWVMGANVNEFLELRIDIDISKTLGLVRKVVNSRRYSNIRIFVRKHLLNCIDLSKYSALHTCFVIPGYEIKVSYKCCFGVNDDQYVHLVDLARISKKKHQCQ